MSTGFWIVIGFAAWCALAVLTGLVIGSMIRRRDSAGPAPSDRPGEHGRGES
jgi:hypothetical protein